MMIFHTYDSELGRFTTQDPIRDGVNWWNYCNGNPITRIDLNGKYDFDIENGIIYCDLNNSEDVALSSTQFVMYEHRGFPTCIAKDDSSGVYLQFNDSETMVNFVTENCYDKDYGAKIENFIDTFGSITSMADVAKISNMSAVSNILGSLSLGIDLMKLKENPTVSNEIDVGIDTIGLLGGIAGSVTAPILSVYLSCVKTEVEWWCQTMAEGTIEINNRAKQYQYEKMMEEIERYEH